MTISEWLNGIGITVSIAASFILIFRGYRKNTKQLSPRWIGAYNLIITVGMILVVGSSIFSPSNNLLFSVATLLVIVFVGFFVVWQARDLLFHQRLPLQELTPQSKKPAPADYAQVKTKRYDEKAYYWNMISTTISDSKDVEKIQILGMTYDISLDEMYVPQKVYEDWSLRDLDENPPELFDPLASLDLEQERKEQLIESARYAIEMIKLHRQCVLVGNPGIGKTTFLKYLTRQIAKHSDSDFQNLIPIYIKLKSFQTNPDLDLLKAILDQCNEKYKLDLTVEAVQEKLHKGELFLLLDGLDETMRNEIYSQAQKAYIDIKEAISGLASQYPMSRIIVTSRKSIYEQQDKELYMKNKSFYKLNLAGFSLKDIRTYIEGRYKLLPANYSRTRLRPDVLLLALQQDIRLRELAAVPLLLSMMTTIYFEGENILADRPALYTKCAELLLRDWDKSRDVQRPSRLTSDQKRKVLEVLAWEIQQGLDSFLSEQTVLKIIRGTIENIPNDEEAKMYLEDIINSSGLLMEDGKGYYGFSQLIMQEYFIARYLKSQKEDPDRLLLSRLNNPWWENILILYASYTDQIQSWLRLLSKYEDIFHIGLLFAGRGIAARSVEERSEVGGQTLENLKKSLSTVKYQSEADEIVHTLVAIADSGTKIRLLEKYMTKGELYPDLRLSFAKCLPGWGDSSISETVVNWLFARRFDASVPVETKMYLAYALGALGEPSVAIRLVKYLGRGHKPGTKREVSIASLELQDYWTLQEKPVLEKVIRSLKRLGNTDIINDLCALLNNPPALFETDQLGKRHEERDGDIHKRDETLSMVRDGLLILIAGTLGVLGRPSPGYDVTDPQLDKQHKCLIDSLASVVKDASRSVPLRSACISSLREVAIPRSKDVITQEVVKTLQLLQGDESIKGHWEILSRIKVVLWILNETPAKPGVAAMLSEKNSGLQARLGLIDFLVQQKADELINDLIDSVRDNTVEIDVRSRIARALGKLGNKKVAADLLSYAREESGADLSVQKAVIVSLGMLYDAGNVSLKDLKAVLSQKLFNAQKNENALDMFLVCSDVLDDISGLDENDKRIIRKRLSREVDNQPGSDLLPIQKAVLGKLGEQYVREDLIKFVCDYNIDKEDNRQSLPTAEDYDKQREINKVFKALEVLFSVEPLEGNKERRANREWHRLVDRMYVPQAPVEIKVRIAQLLGKVGQDKDLCIYLVEKMSTEDTNKFPLVQDNIYRAAKLLSSRAGLRLYRDDHNKIQWQEWEKLLKDPMNVSA